MRIAVVGGAGTLGRQVTAELTRRGHEVRVLSRRSPQFPVDLATGQGLAAALADCSVVVDASNTQRNARQVMVEGSARLLAAGQQAGVGHHVCISIVGCDRVPIGYYRVKVDQERAVERGPVPWTIVRATQFHELVASMLDRAARYRVLPTPSMPLQPVAALEVARALADAAESDPSGAGSASPDRRSAACASWPALGGLSPAGPRCCCPSRCRAAWAGRCAWEVSPRRMRT